MQLFPSEAFKLLKGFNELKYVDFTNCYSLTGAFLEDLVTKGGGNSLEVMILHGLYGLDKVRTLISPCFLTSFSLSSFTNTCHVILWTGGGYKVYESSSCRKVQATTTSCEFDFLLCFSTKLLKFWLFDHLAPFTISKVIKLVNICQSGH
ncbi:uncharacterized protein LOC122195721 [Lactuca sativa]|uniref:uncharacterized protein LOC122195721 n=1 Tax=Lactuca sativa TaxID=4236 RepID=UPI001C68A10C|nr:uncharacterized protein LOC122195721 [Lactuca sativa]